MKLFINAKHVLVCLCYQIGSINLVVWFLSSQIGLEYGLMEWHIAIMC